MDGKLEGTLSHYFGSKRRKRQLFVSCIIGSHKIDQALLDLGASVNLIPYTVYEQLGLGEIKPTRITLQLADRSIKIPRGIVGPSR